MESGVLSYQSESEHSENAYPCAPNPQRYQEKSRRINHRKTTFQHNEPK